MAKSRNNLLTHGRSPRAHLPLFKLYLTLAVAAGFCCIGCSRQESVSPDFSTAPGSLDHGTGSGRDIPCLQTEICLDLRLPAENGIGPGIRTKAGSWWLIQRLDLFVFDNDEIRRLDSYTRSFVYSPEVIQVPSASGDKIVVAIANRSFPDGFVTGIHCYDDLRHAVAELTEDHPSWPVMSGETAFTAGQGHSCRLTLEPLMSAVEVRSLRSRGFRLSKVKVYLTGISNRAELLRTEGFLPSETLNGDGLSENDLGRLAYSGMVYRFLGDGTPSGEGATYGSTSLYCYPNEAEEESVGSPFTKLVVEGLLDGETRRYVIPVNRGVFTGAEEGIGRNCRYVFDLTLTSP